MAHKGVQSAVIVNADGIPIRTMPATMEHKEAVMFPGVLMPVIQKARQMIKALDPQNDFSALRMRSAKNEVLVYPEVRCSTALHGSKSDAPVPFVLSAPIPPLSHMCVHHLTPLAGCPFVPPLPLPPLLLGFLFARRRKTTRCLSCRVPCERDVQRERGQKHRAASRKRASERARM